MAKFDFQGKLYEQGRRVITDAIETIKDSSGNSIGTLDIVTDREGKPFLNINLNPPKGERGEKGDSPEITIGTVTTLAGGSRATVTAIPNDKGYTLNFGIPQGSQGKQGKQGKQGVQGEPGYTPKIDVIEEIDVLEPGATA